MDKKKTASRFFRWIKSDLPDCEPNPVLLLGVTKLGSPRSTSRSRHRPQTIVGESEYQVNQETKKKITKSLRISLNADNNKKVKFSKSETVNEHDFESSSDLSVRTAIEKLKDNYSKDTHELRNRNNFKHNTKSVYIDNRSSSSPETYHKTVIKIGQTTSQKFDRNSNANQQETVTTPQFTSSFEINKNNKVFDRKANLTKQNSFEGTEEQNHHQTIITTQPTSVTTIKTTPKVLITRLKKSSDILIDSILIDEQQSTVPKKSSLAPESAVVHHQTSSKKDKEKNNCRFIGFIPKCTRRNDSTEPESLSEEANNNFDLINSKKVAISKNNSLIMDRSVDSIGDCSLDVDAESTDFSDTSGSLNLVTPSSGKDFPREFTSRIQERCQFPPIHHHQQQQLPIHLQQQLQQQQTTTVLDPSSGKITTVLSSPINENNSGGVKKPSYLNLACCVNGYSNLTTYDSKLRQNINKSREVSPIRPISHTLQYNRENNYLVVPIPVPIKLETPIMDGSTQRSYMSTEKRIFTSQMMNDGGKDQVDDVSTTTFKAFKTTKFVNSSTTITTSSKTSSSILPPDMTPTKSFIQQRVERLYGPGALAQGFYNNKRLSDGNGNVNGNILAERYLNKLNSQESNSYKTNKLNGHTTTMTMTTCENGEYLKNGESTSPQSLPVLRHLRPEFRDQLPISPKRGVRGSDGLNGIMATSPTPSPTQTPTKLSTTTTKTTIISNNTHTINKNGITDKSTKHDDDYNNEGNVNNIKSEKSNILSSSTSSCSSSRANGGDNMALLTNANNKKINSVNSIHIDLGKTPSSPKETETMQCLNYNNNNNNKIENGVEKIKTVNTYPPRDDSKFNKTICVTSTEMEKNTSNGFNNKILEAPINGDHTNKPEVKQINNENLETVQDGNYFLVILKRERDRLLLLADNTEKEMDLLVANNEVSEEILGYLRSASGKARLLASQKMQQFEGLCHNNLHTTPGEFPTTVEDLQGFWDMVMLQVDHVDSLFKEIESWKANNWKKPVIEKPAPPQGAKLIKRPIASKSSSSSASAQNSGSSTRQTKSATASQAAQKREAQRKQLAELRRKNKMEQKEQPNGVEIFIAGDTS